MGRKKILEKRLAKIQAKITELRAKMQASEDVVEMRGLAANIDDLTESEADIKEEIEAIDEDIAAAGGEQRGLTPGMIIGSGVSTGQGEASGYGSMEYRQAFMNYATRGVAIPQDVAARAASDAGTTISTEIGALIPTTVMSEVIRQLSGAYGQVYAKVRKLNVQGGIKFPISKLKAKFRWVAEATGSEGKTKAGEADSFVSFGANLGEIKIATSLIAAVQALDVFEQEIAVRIAEAFMEAMDTAIINGSGTGCPLGITQDSRVTNVVEFSDSKGEIDKWDVWRKNLFAKIPIKKRGSGEFLFSASTFETHLMSMKDKNDRPLAKEAADIVNGDADGKFFGRNVTFVEPDIIKDYDTAEAGDVIGIYWVPSDYAVNTNLQFGIQRYFDQDTNEWVDKALVIVDGKILDTTGCYLLKKAA